MSSLSDAVAVHYEGEAALEQVLQTVAAEAVE